jgi:hypothetical protein
MKGRTIWEMITGQNKPVPVEQQYKNPLNVQVGSVVSLKTIDFINDLFKVTKIRSWNREINGNIHPMTDYYLNKEETLFLRAVPETGDVPYRFLILKEDLLLPWSNDVIEILEACTYGDEFYIDRGTPQEQKFIRLGGAMPIPAQVYVLADLDHNGVLEEDEVKKVPITMWDYCRTTLDEADQEYTEYLYVELSGIYVTTTQIIDGNKSIVM